MLPALRQPMGRSQCEGQISEHERTLPVMEMNSHTPLPMLLTCDSSLFHQVAVRGQGGVRMHLSTLYSHSRLPCGSHCPLRTEERVGPLLRADLQAHTCKLCQWSLQVTDQGPICWPQLKTHAVVATIFSALYCLFAKWIEKFLTVCTSF